MGRILDIVYKKGNALELAERNALDLLFKCLGEAILDLTRFPVEVQILASATVNDRCTAIMNVRRAEDHNDRLIRIEVPKDDYFRCYNSVGGLTVETSISMVENNIAAILVGQGLKPTGTYRPITGHGYATQLLDAMKGKTDAGNN
jgi:hypothetical protein